VLKNISEKQLDVAEGQSTQKLTQQKNI